MSFLRREPSWLGHRLCAGLVLGAYLLTASGVPLPLSSDKDRSLPFPCQDHACGCRSAEECWLHCCCFTPLEKFAWAREHHVQPPAYAERPAVLGWNVPRQRDLAEGRPRPATCCPHCGAPARTAAAAPSCCARVSSACAHAAPPPAAPGPRWVIGLTVAHCRGLSTDWVTCGSVLPLPPPLTWHPWSPLDATLSYPDGLPLAPPSTPPDPPPRSPNA
jgi:hypothetical protein